MWRFQALASARRIFRLGIRRFPRHCRENIPISISGLIEPTASGYLLRWIWRTNWSSRKARIGDNAEVVRQVRNLAHPARYAADHYRSRVTAKYLQRQFEVVLLCRDWLAERNNKSLREHMNAEGLLLPYGISFQCAWPAPARPTGSSRWLATNQSSELFRQEESLYFFGIGNHSVF
jgi:hypothetical protein